jgi:hypothetical protein
MDKVIVGTSVNVEAEYGYGQPKKFTLLHLYNDEPVSVEGFDTKEGVLAALKEYHGAEIERLFTELGEI